VALAKSKKPSLILMDIKMPEMDGIEASRILKNDIETRNIPIVAVTASTMKSEEEKIGGICDEFLRKPISRKDLLGILLRHLKHSLAPTEPLAAPEGEEPFCCGTSKDTYDLEGLRERMEIELVPLWAGLQETMIVNQVLEFAEKTIEIATTHKATKLAAWGDKLRNMAMLFDMAGMEGALAQFPSFLGRNSKA